MKIERMQ